MKKYLHKKLHLKRDNVPKYPIGSNSQDSISKNKLSKNRRLNLNKKFLTFVGILILVLGSFNLIDISEKVNISQDVVKNNESPVITALNTTTTILSTTSTTSSTTYTTKIKPYGAGGGSVYVNPGSVIVGKSHLILMELAQ